MQRSVTLEGRLAKFSSIPVVVDADTTFMVTQGLIHRFGAKFKEALRGGSWHIFKGEPAKRNDIGEEEIQFKLSDKVTELFFLPAIEGASAGARIIIGVVLIAAIMFFTAGAGMVAVGLTSASTAAGTMGASLVSMGYGIGLSLISGGLLEMLSPKPTMKVPEQGGPNVAKMFNGVVNVTEQGGPVPIVCGRVRRAGSVVLSAGLAVEQQIASEV